MKPIVASALGLIASCSAAFAQSPSLALAPTVPEDVRFLPYVEPGQLVDIGGRRINLKCSGAGAPTVVLMAGFASWSPVWYKTQPEIAKRTRVCAFDRPGYGFSDPAPRPPILNQIPEDLHAALKAANLPGPYVLVGHSLGGLEARMFAERWPQEVAGMVLLDTSPAAEYLIEAGLPGFDESRDMEKGRSEALRCAFLVANGPLDPSHPDYPVCVPALPPETPAAFRKVWPQFFTKDFAVAKLSLITALYTHRYDSADSIRLGDKPLVVLSSDVGRETSGPQVTFWRGYRKQWFAQHEALARLSSRGVHRVVKDTSHMIHLDEPQSVADAVDEVLRQLPARSRSPSP